MQKSFKLCDVFPNPFRHMERYPINADKVQALIESYGRTGYWGNIVGRMNGKGIQIAYGHHRKIAMDRSMKPTDSVDIIVKDLSDSDMIRVMADENMSEWHSNALVEQETVRAVVMAYAEGKIELERPKSNQGAKWRYAPSFLQVNDKTFNGDKSFPYNAESIGKFLGWMTPGGQVSNSVRYAIDALEKAEELEQETGDSVVSEGLEGVVTGMGREPAKAVFDSFEKVRMAHEKAGKTKKASATAALKDVGKIVEEVRKENGGMRGIQALASKRVDEIVKPPPMIPTIEKFCRDLALELLSMLGSRDKRWEKLGLVVKCRDQIRPDIKTELTVSLERVIERCTAMIDVIEGRGNKLLK